MLESNRGETENENPEIVKKEISIDKAGETAHFDKLKSEFSFDSASKNILIGKYWIVHNIREN